MSETHELLKLAFATYLKEVENFEKNGVKISAARARQSLSEIKKLVVDRRNEIQQMKNEM